ncbi:hypothetical protein V7166_18635 [Bacillus thuringiensis]
MDSVIYQDTFYQVRIKRELQARNVTKDEIELVHILPLEMVMELLEEECKMNVEGGFAVVINEGSDHFSAISAVSVFFGEEGFQNSCDYIVGCLAP